MTCCSPSCFVTFFLIFRTHTGLSSKWFNFISKSTVYCFRLFCVCFMLSIAVWFALNWLFCSWMRFVVLSFVSSKSRSINRICLYWPSRSFSKPLTYRSKSYNTSLRAVQPSGSLIDAISRPLICICFWISSMYKL